MPMLFRCSPVLLALGLALAGCDLGQESKGRGVADPNAIGSTFRDTRDNQVVLQVEGLR
jgi:hypothetical protein